MDHVQISMVFHLFQEFFSGPKIIKNLTFKNQPEESRVTLLYTEGFGCGMAGV